MRSKQIQRLFKIIINLVSLQVLYKQAVKWECCRGHICGLDTYAARHIGSRTNCIYGPDMAWTHITLHKALSIFIVSNCVIRVPTDMLWQNSLTLPDFLRQLFPDFPWTNGKYLHLNEATLCCCEPTYQCHGPYNKQIQGVCTWYDLMTGQPLFSHRWTERWMPSAARRKLSLQNT